MTLEWYAQSERLRSRHGVLASATLLLWQIMDDELPVAPGTMIGDRYRVDKLLGRGGMGAVYSGRHMELQERVAIKFLHREHAGHADRFFREARAASRIRSEHVVRIYDVGRMPGGEPYIVMEYLEGGDLADRLERGPLDLVSAADILIDVCEALAQAHALGIVHRDLKPANIYLARDVSGDDCVKLLDFGVAKVPDAGSLTKTATLLGSPVYMAPEQLMGARGVDARSDIWSLGVVLYELLTNALPFEGDSIVHQGILVREMSTPKVTALRPDLPASIDAVIERCLGKEQRDRYQDVAEFATALAPFASPATQPSVPRIRRILSAVRESKPDLASTLLEDDEEASSEPVRIRVSTGGGSQGSSKTKAATRVSGVGRAPESLPALSEPVVSSAPAVALASSHAQKIDTVPDGHAERKQRNKLVMIGAGIVVGVIGLFGARELLKPSATVSVDPPPALSVSTPAVESSAPAASASVAASTELPALPPSTEVPAVASTPPSTTNVRHGSGKGKPTASAAPAPAASPAPAKPNCNPPYTIVNNIREPKPGCM